MDNKLPSSQKPFEFEVIERVVELRQLSLYLKEYIEENGDVDFLSKQIDRLDNIIDILENFWEI